MKGVRLFIAAVAMVLALVFSIVLQFAGEEEQAKAACGGPTGSVASVSGVPAGSVAGYAPDPSLNGAAQIMKAAADSGIDVHGATLGVATAMGESSLTPINHGDLAGPDSLGWFQQRDPWGSREERLDAYRSALLFFNGGSTAPDGYEEPGLLDIPGWESLPPTTAIHRVQNNADPNYYTKFWGPATEVVAALSGVDVTVLNSSTGASPVSCTGGAAGAAGAVAVGAGGWTNPVPDGTFTSGFGTRWGAPHNGDDLAAPLGTPIYAAAGAVDAAGNPTGKPATVIDSGPASGFGQWIRIDHGNGYITVYGHMYPQDLLVHVGDQVTAGQQIARVGSNGQSTGPHCHVEVHLGDQPVDPLPFFAAHGVSLQKAA